MTELLELPQSKFRPLRENYVYHIILSMVDKREYWEVDEITKEMLNGQPLNTVKHDPDSHIVWMFVEAGSPLTAMCQSFINLREEFHRLWPQQTNHFRVDGMENHLRRFIQ